MVPILVSVLVGCAPLYLPPVPEAPPFEVVTRVATTDAKLGDDGRPQLDLELADVTEAGWLAVQWLAPSGREAASSSVWVEPGGPSVRLSLPPDVETTAGEWRAVVSLHGKLLRQFTFELQ